MSGGALFIKSFHCGSSYMKVGTDPSVNHLTHPPSNLKTVWICRDSGSDSILAIILPQIDDFDLVLGEA